MQKIIVSIAGLLLAAARVRAECVMHRNARVPVQQDDLYSSNAGGWN
jgi:hypothetical protein